MKKLKNKKFLMRLGVGIIVITLAISSYFYFCPNKNNTEIKNENHKNQTWEKLNIYNYPEDNLSSINYKDNLVYTILDVESLSKIKKLFSKAVEIEGICNSGSCNHKANPNIMIDCAINSSRGDYVIEIFKEINDNEPMQKIDLWLYQSGKDKEQAIISYQKDNCKDYYQLSEKDTKTLRNILVHKQKSDEVSKYKINNKLISIKVNKDSLTKSKATFTFTNHTNQTYTYGEPFSLEYQKDGKWYKLNYIIDNVGFHSPGYNVKAKESKEKEYSWGIIYGNLAPGTYRLVTNVFADADIPITEEDNVYISAEFIIE